MQAGDTVEAASNAKRAHELLELRTFDATIVSELCGVAGSAPGVLRQGRSFLEPVDERLCLDKIRMMRTFPKRVVDGTQHLSGALRLAVSHQQFGEAGCGAQLQQFGLLAVGNRHAP
jgi:hypothetical protein